MCYSTRRPWGVAAGEVDREALGKLVFGDRQARKQLNKATHLPIFRELVWQVLRHWCSCHWIVVSFAALDKCCA